MENVVISKEMLIDLLNVDMMNERSIGNNQITILLLKKLNSNYTPDESIDKKLKTAVENDNVFNNIIVKFPNEKREFIDFIREGKKLAAVKLFKEMTGWGLKESKDVTDRFAEML